MNGEVVQETKMNAKQFLNNAGARARTPPPTMESGGGSTNGQDDSMIRFSPSSPFVTMRHYISEFDPDESSTYMSMNALKLAESWKIYIDTFMDLCDIDKVPIENRRKLLLLLAGNKLRRLLSQLESAASDSTTTLEETVRILTQHFENRRAIQMARFSFFYGSQNRRKEGESITDWTSRLIKLSEKCQFSKETTDGMTVNDALMVVMYKQSQDDDENGGSKKNEALTTSPKSGEKLNGKSLIKADLQDDEEEDDGMPVELEWGDDTANGDGPQVLKLEVETFQYTNGDRAHQEERTTSDSRETPDRNFTSPGENLTHADMDLLRRARGGPCICPNCTLFPKRRAGKHNCHIAGCGREYSKTSHLRAHLVSHCNVLPFACSWVGCGKRFYRTDQLTRHARIHTGEKKFACQFCEHAFSRSDHLTKHLKRHTNHTGSQVNSSISGGANVNANNHNRNPAGQEQRTSPGAMNNVPNTSNNITAAMVAHQQQMLSMPALHYNLSIGQKTPAQFSYH